MKLEFLKRLFGGRKGETKAKFRAEPLAVAIQGDILDQYTIDQATVYIVDQGGKGLYVVKEPSLNQQEQETYSRLMENLWYGMRPAAAKVGDKAKYIEGFIWDAASAIGAMEEVQRSIQKYRYFIAKDGFGYGKLHIAAMDPEIEDISVAGFGTPVMVYPRNPKYSKYHWLETNIVFHSEDELRAFAQRLAQICGKSVTTAFPFVDGSTPEGHRVQITLGGEISHPGTAIDMRKFTPIPLGLPYMIARGTISPLMAAYLWFLQWPFREVGSFLVYLGRPGSGKTTLMNNMLSTIPLSCKLGTAEDTRELQLPHSNWICLTTRTSYSLTERQYDVDLFQLIRLLLRQRPQYIAVGEIRGVEARDLIHAASVGLGCSCTLHTDSPDSALTRLRAEPITLPEGSLMLIWAFVTMNQVILPDGSSERRVVDISEVVPGVKLELQNIFGWDSRADSFSPTRARDVLERSVRMRTIERLTGMSRRDVARELEARARFLQTQVEEEKLGFAEFVDAVGKYYAKRKGKA